MAEDEERPRQYKMDDKQFLSYCEEFWQWKLKDDPEMAGHVGYLQFTDRWTDTTEAAYLKRHSEINNFLTYARAMDVSACSPQVELSYTLLVYNLDLYLTGLKFKSYLMPITPIDGIHIVSGIYINSIEYEREENFNKYISRLKALPQRIQQTLEALKKGCEQSIVFYESSLREVIRVLESLSTKPVEELDLYKPCLRNTEGLSSTFLDGIKNTARNILSSDVQPSFNALKIYLQKEYILKCRTSPGVFCLPDGKAMYQQLLLYHLSYSVTPDEVHALGIKEVARIKQLIINLAKKEGLPETLSEIVSKIKERQTKFQSADEALAYVKVLCCKRIQPNLLKMFKNLPNVPLQVSLTAEIKKHFPLGYYINGSGFGNRQATYYVNANDLENKCLPFKLPSVSLHESEPGHHTQASYSQSNKCSPNFRKFMAEYRYYLAPGFWSKYTAYVEGWGCYCEALGEEMGIYQNNYEMLGRYGEEILRAARMVVDTGLHAFGWNKDKAIAYFVENTFMVEFDSLIETERSILIPGQGCGYKYGELKIWEFRRWAEKELGNDFDLREFHHRLLSSGTVPLTILEKIVKQYIEEIKK